MIRKPRLAGPLKLECIVFKAAGIGHRVKAGFRFGGSVAPFENTPAKLV